MFIPLTPEGAFIVYIKNKRFIQSSCMVNAITVKAAKLAINGQ
jgi:hypothetical protein